MLKLITLPDHIITSTMVSDYPILLRILSDIVDDGIFLLDTYLYDEIGIINNKAATVVYDFAEWHEVEDGERVIIVNTAKDLKSYIKLNGSDKRDMYTLGTHRAVFNEYGNLKGYSRYIRREVKSHIVIHCDDIKINDPEKRRLIRSPITKRFIGCDDSVALITCNYYVTECKVE